MGVDMDAITGYDLLSVVALYALEMQNSADMDAIKGYDLLKDTFMIILAIGGISVAFVSMIFKIIVDSIKASTVKDTESMIKDNSNNIQATIHANVYAMAFWSDYKATGKTEYLNRAIERTRVAYNEYASKLDKEKSENEKLICWIKNNWAYYLAERRKCKVSQKGDEDLARNYAKEAYEKIGKFPEHAEAWSDTYKFVQEQFKP